MDFESTWVDKARERAAALQKSHLCTYQVANADALPYSDACFDLVTCQTLLMHVPDPVAVLKEMLRILKPGGRILLAEPNNLVNQFINDSVNNCLSPTEIGSLMTLLSACSRGRTALGRGDDCIGDSLPRLLRPLGVTNLSVSQNEKTSETSPPYSDAQKAELEQSIGYANSGFWLWNKKDAQTLYLAGGGHDESFQADYAVFERHTECFKTQVNEEIYCSSNPSVHYIVSAIKAVG